APSPPRPPRPAPPTPHRRHLPLAARLAARVLPALVVLGFGLWDLTGPSVWRDEAVSYAIAQRTPGQILQLAHHTDAVHAAYYLFLHAVFAVTGPSPIALRLPSVLAAVATAGLVTAVGRRLSGTRAGLLGGLAWACAPMVSRYAQEGRPYAFASLGVAAAAYFLVRAATDQHRSLLRQLPWWAAYATAVAAAGVANVLALLALAAFAVTVLAWRLPLPVLLRWAGASAVGCLGALPVLLVANGQGKAVSWLTPPTWHTVAELAVRFAGTRYTVLPIAALALCALLVPGRPARPRPDSATARPHHRPPTLTALALPLLLLPPAVLLLISLPHPLYQPRYVLYALIGLAWLVGAGLDAGVPRLPARRGTATLAALLALAAVTALAAPAHLRVREADGHGDNLRALSRIVAAHARDGDAVLFESKTRRSAAFAYPGDFARTTDVALKSVVSPTDPDGRERDPREIAAALRAHPRVWVVSGPGQHRGPGTRDGKLWHAVKSSHRLSRMWHVGIQAVRLYVRDDRR
ncbi:hypothetical protein OK074_6825, partial [Actinobacteria bacterium OK074]